MIPWSKAVQLGIAKTSRPASDKTKVTFCEDPQDPDFCPVQTTWSYINKCHPHAKKFYASIATATQRELYLKQFGKEIWFNPSGTGTDLADGTFKANTTFNLGHNMVSKNLKKLAELIGCEDFHKASGHAFRALMITVALNNNLSAHTIASGARHSSLNSQKNYAVKEGPQEASRQFALDLDGKVKKRSKKSKKETVPKTKQETAPANDRILPAVSGVPPARFPDYSKAPPSSDLGVPTGPPGASPGTAAEILKLEARKKSLSFKCKFESWKLQQQLLQLMLLLLLQHQQDTHLLPIIHCHRRIILLRTLMVGGFLIIIVVLQIRTQTG